jgi:polar amino acid transport system substrate-binding protein
VYTVPYDGKGSKLEVITSSGYEPFEILDDKGVLSGYDIDLAKFIAKELNHTLNWADAEFDNIIINLISGDVDFAIAAITPTSDRKKSVDFSIEYFFESFTVALFREDDAFTSIDQLKDKTVAAQTGTIQADLLEQLKLAGKVGKVVTFNYPATAMQSLKTNKIDAFFVEKSIADGLLVKFNK